MTSIFFRAGSTTNRFFSLVIEHCNVKSPFNSMIFPANLRISRDFPTSQLPDSQVVSGGGFVAIGARRVEVPKGVKH